MASVSLVAGVRARSATTPGRLRLLSVALLVMFALLWLAAFTTTVARQGAVSTVSDDAGPSFVSAQRIHADLSEVDATIARAFLARGVEPPKQREAYARALASASQHVIDLASAGGSPQARELLAVLAREIPVYAGLVERARANNRLGNVVGAAYLRQASALMQNTILPAVDTLASIDAERIDTSYKRATAWFHPVLVALAGVACLAALVAVQLLLFRRTHRVLNVPLVAATLLVAVVTGVTLAAFSVERSRLVDGRDDAFVPMTVVAQARVLALRAWGDESLALIARGNGAAFNEDAIVVAQRLGYDESGDATGTGVLPAAVNTGGPDAGTRADLDEVWRAYLDTSIKVRSSASEAGGFQNAVDLALNDGTTEFNRFDERADAALAASQQRFDDRVSAASGSLGGIAVGITAGVVLAAVLAAAGLQTRINEYR